MSREQYREFRALVIEMVLATDLSKHFDFVSQLKSAAERSLNPEVSPDPSLVLTTSIKLCDLGHSFKGWDQHERWSGWVTEEFFLLGDREKAAGIAVSPLCDRQRDTNLPKNQLGFFEFLCYPFYKAVARVLPAAEVLLEPLEENFDEWRERHAVLLAEAEGEERKTTGGGSPCSSKPNTSPQSGRTEEPVADDRSQGGSFQKIKQAARRTITERTGSFTRKVPAEITQRSRLLIMPACRLYARPPPRTQMFGNRSSEVVTETRPPKSI